MKSFFQGEAYTIEEILGMLESQGLVIEDRDRATHVLNNVSYSRLKNYMTALMSDRGSHRFRAGATFENAYALYGFDRRLRELIFHEMEKIEISIRTRIAYASNGSEKGYWFLNQEYFKSEGSHQRILRHLKYELERSDNEAILNFRNKYSNEFPPSWILLEAASMGTLYNIFDELGSEKMRENIASYYGMSPHTFSSWVHHLVSIRNHCAHHNRMWNIAPPVKAGLPQGLTRPFPDVRDKDRYHIYLTFCILKYFQDAVKPSNSFAQRLKMLINNFPMIDARDMGFPQNWQEQSFWK